MRNYTDEQLRAINEADMPYNGKLYTRYQISRMQRAPERKVRSAKRQYLAESAAGVDASRSAVRLKAARQRSKQFIRATSGRADGVRTSVAGFGRSEAGKAGLQPRIIRKATGTCCEWCKNLAGTYDYPVENEDVYRRHERCRCTVDYDPGGAKRFQDVHTKEWKTAEERAKVEARKTLGIDPTKGVIQTRINKGEYDLKLSQQHLKHVEGTQQFAQYQRSRAAKGKGPQGRLTISPEEAQRLIDTYAGKGAPRITKGGSVAQVECVTTDAAVGACYNAVENRWDETKRVAIHYGKKGTHIVPVEEE